MLVVILGAGASYDSVPDLNRALQIEAEDPVGRFRSFRPPLATGLFENFENFGQVLDKFPACRPLVASLRIAIGHGADLEAELEQLLLRAEQGNPHLYRPLTALRFYLREVIWDCGENWFARAHGVLNHSLLLHRLELWRRERDQQVCFVTFNYDRLLEKAFADVLNLRLTAMESYVERDDYTILKLHGSVDWAHPVEAGIEITGLAWKLVPGAIIEQAESLKVSKDFWFLGDYRDEVRPRGAC